MTDMINECLDSLVPVKKPIRERVLPLVTAFAVVIIWIATNYVSSRMPINPSQLAAAEALVEKVAKSKNVSNDEIYRDLTSHIGRPLRHFNTAEWDQALVYLAGRLDH